MCLFSPTELQIAAGTSELDFIRIIKAVAALDQAEDAWKGDASLFAIKTWGLKHGLEVTASATGYRTFSLRKMAHVAEEFPPTKRINGFSFAHYRQLLPFPREWSYEFIVRHAGEHIPSNSFRAQAELEYGGNPCKSKQPKKRSVLIREDLYARLRPHSANRKVHILIERVLEEWIRTQPDIIPTPTIIYESATARHKREALARKAAKQALREQREAELKTKRNTYAERRAQQIADGVKPIQEKETTVKYSIRVAWRECRGESVIDAPDGPQKYQSKSNQNPTKFYSEQDALAANEKHFTEAGYHEQVVRCEVHNCWHLSHIFTSEA